MKDRRAIFGMIGDAARWWGEACIVHCGFEVIEDWDPIPFFIFYDMWGCVSYNVLKIVRRKWTNNWMRYSSQVMVMCDMYAGCTRGKHI